MRRTGQAGCLEEGCVLSTKIGTAEAGFRGRRDRFPPAWGLDIGASITAIDGVAAVSTISNGPRRRWVEVVARCGTTSSKRRGAKSQEFAVFDIFRSCILRSTFPTPLATLYQCLSKIDLLLRMCVWEMLTEKQIQNAPQRDIFLASFASVGNWPSQAWNRTWPTMPRDPIGLAQRDYLFASYQTNPGLFKTAKQG